VFDVAMEDFVEKVVQVSHETPVIVDFWADWCAPCKMLSPVLEKVVESFKGAVLLAKIDVESNQQLAVHLGIKSIPAVKVFKDGAIVDEFVGVIPEPDIVKLIKSVIGDGDDASVEEYLTEAERLISAGNLDEADELYRAVLSMDSKNLQAFGGIGRIALIKEGPEGARAIIGSLDEVERENSAIKALLALIEFHEACGSCGSPEKCEAESAKKPSDKDLRFRLGCCYAINMKYREAFEAFLAILAKDMNYGEGKAKKALVSMFDIAGQNSQMTSEFRKKLANLLF
jgi:putative thioredoxin